MDHFGPPPPSISEILQYPPSHPPSVRFKDVDQLNCNKIKTLYLPYVTLFKLPPPPQLIVTFCVKFPNPPPPSFNMYFFNGPLNQTN